MQRIFPVTLHIWRAEKPAKAILSFPIEEKKLDLQKYKKSCYHDSLTYVMKELITDG